MHQRLVGPNSIEGEANIMKRQSRNPIITSDRTRVGIDKHNVDSATLQTLRAKVFDLVIQGLRAHLIYHKYVHPKTVIVDSAVNPPITETIYSVRKPEILQMACMSALQNQIAALDTKTFCSLFMYNYYQNTDAIYKPIFDRNAFGKNCNPTTDESARAKMMQRMVIDPAVGEAKKIYIASEMKDEFDFNERLLVQDSKHLRHVHSGAGAYKPTKPIISHHFNALGNYRAEAMNKKMTGMLDSKMQTMIMNPILSNPNNQVATLLRKNAELGKFTNETHYQQTMSNNIENEKRVLSDHFASSSSLKQPTPTSTSQVASIHQYTMHPPK